MVSKVQKHIEIIRSTTLGLSSLSKVSCDAIYKLLSAHYEQVGVSVINNLWDLQLLVSKQPDLVFMGMKFLPSTHSLGTEDPNKIWISEYLDNHNIAYTGSNKNAHELELDKHLAKQLVEDAGLDTSAFYVAKHGQKVYDSDIALNYPVFIKPTNRGGGLGIDDASVAHDFAGLLSKVESMSAKYKADSLIEEYLPGREFSVAIIKGADQTTLLALPLELVAPENIAGHRILSSSVKLADTETFLEVKDKEIRHKITTLALDVFRVIGARDYGRIDIRLDKNGLPHFLEANLIPSLIENYGNFPKACFLNLGMSYKNVILRIVELGLSRSEQPEEPNVPVFTTILKPLNLPEVLQPAI